MADNLLYQAKLALYENLRLKVVRKMFEMHFGEKPSERRTVDQLRGIEGSRVKKLYELLARQYRVEWRSRRYNRVPTGVGMNRFYIGTEGRPVPSEIDTVSFYES